LGGLLDFTTNDFWDKLGSELCEGAAGGFAGDNLSHLLSDGSDLRGGGIGGLLDLIWSTLGECDGEQTEEVVISGLDCDVGLNQGLPLSDEGSELVGCEVETVEVGQAVLSLDLIDTELDLSESVVLILLEIGQRNLEDSSLQCIVCVLETGGSVDKGLSDTARYIRFLQLYRWKLRIVLSDLEGRWGLLYCQSLQKPFQFHQCAYLDLVPILAGEGILSLLLETLLTLRKALVPVVLSDFCSWKFCPSIQPQFHIHLLRTISSQV
jgi:hypothetical protein